MLHPLSTTVVPFCFPSQPSLLNTVYTGCLSLHTSFTKQSIAVYLVLAPGELQLLLRSSLLLNAVLVCLNSTKHLNPLKILPIVSWQDTTFLWFAPTATSQSPLQSPFSPPFLTWQVDSLNPVFLPVYTTSLHSLTQSSCSVLRLGPFC